VGIENFTSLFGQPRFWKVVGNTVAYAAASVLFQVPLALLVAIILSGPIRGRNTIRAILYLPNMISGAALGVVFALVYNPRFGLLNRLLDGLGLESLSQDWLFTVSTAWWAVTATFVFLIGFFVILLMTEIVSLPAEVMEAATIDGASSVQRHLHVTLPLLRNIIGTCVLLSLLGSLAFFDTVFVMTGGGPGDATATISLYGYREYLNGDWGSANAVGVFIVIAGGALILSVRRLFRIGERD
jgi:raffinose/stachyose/melibiose transport system permease protein